ncbi:AAA family ATPase [Streptomyces sp. NBC_01136]|uniref:AAA family ATPase n=1 Tax=Streptomyces sp. NBC_01136 TaxID=2903754 RepID=UPI00386C1766|nr:AAA family ATPase [Streptomyces sp. NBC_01136]
MNLYGRDDEVRVLARIWAGDGPPGQVLAVRGEPGTGKTALLSVAERLARAYGALVLRTGGVEVAARPPFACLEELLRPLLQGLPGLDPPERRALLSAFELARSFPEQALVHRSVARLLSRASRQRRVLLVVDDAQWLDAQTLEAVAFIAERARELPVDLVCAMGTRYPRPLERGRWPEITVGRLSAHDAERLLRQHAPTLSSARRRTLLREAAGHPLALLELSSRQPMPADRGDDSPVSRLEGMFGLVAADLPRPVRDILLVAAVDDSGDLREVLDAAARLIGREVDESVLTSAVEGRLLRVLDTWVEFTHPLVRSGLLRGESPARRQCAHRALADVLADPYRRAWHRAQAESGPNGEAADLLDATTGDLLARGAVSSAIVVLRRAAALTTRGTERGSRLLRAAELAVQLGQEDLVDLLVTTALRQELTVLDRAKAQWLLETLSEGAPADVARVWELCEVAADAAWAGDENLALDLLLSAALRCWRAESGPLARAAVVDGAELMGEACPPLRDNARWLAVLGVAEPVASGRTVCAALDALRPAEVEDPHALRLLGMAAHAVGHDVRAAEVLDRAAQLLRAQGRVGPLAQVLALQVVVHTELGHLERAEVAAQEAVQLARDSGRPVSAEVSMYQARLWARRGDTELALRQFAETEPSARANHLNSVLFCVQRVKAESAFVQGRYEEAYRTCRTLLDSRAPGYHPRLWFDALGLFAETAVRSGNALDARLMLRNAEHMSLITPAPLLRMQLAHARDVLAAGPGKSQSND